MNGDSYSSRDGRRGRDYPPRGDRDDRRDRPLEATAIESEKTATLGVTAEETANGTAIVAPLAATHDAMTTKDPRDETEIHLTTAGEAGDVNPDGMMVDSVDKSLGAA
ncbi:hypothetical protein ACCO45_001135 [Purpureocillium lilacinum]|uniref:Uncharacterized protein n=1 Tax=Purpureocillium lilacinum TaxID=33203 RepID=A0ACC4E6Q4_PURLI